MQGIFTLVHFTALKMFQLYWQNTNKKGVLKRAEISISIYISVYINVCVYVCVHTLNEGMLYNKIKSEKIIVLSEFQSLLLVPAHLQEK